MPPMYSLAKKKIKVLLLEGVHPSAVNCFKQHGYTEIDQVSTALNEDELAARIGDYHFLGIRSGTQVSHKVLQHAERLNAIGCFCIGTNQVDVEAARKFGIPVFNAPFSNTRSVAELVLAEIIMLLRKVPEKSTACHNGGWLKSAQGSHEARGKTLGIVGYGHIGTQLGVLAEQLGMRVLFYDIETKLSLGNACPMLTLDSLLKTSDVVSLHVPETEQTRNLISARRLGVMKPGACLINASRGTVVDLDALATRLKEGHLNGAAIDVFPVEPKSNDDIFESPLRGLSNVILTPHIGGSTQEAQENIGIEVAHKLIKYSDNGSTLSAVNFPEVSLPIHAESSRLLHIHRNQPGVLTRINQIFAELGVNISGQYLQTDNELGYVVMDVDSDLAEQALEQLKQVPGTIRCRVLH
ncbi:phosphoglycerate dehydrogenase [Aliidiomarina halalkaliphila]|uniref:D-3-phosphoglycerate dehydrogenase n=1 Tax=Aliidiomarina halalkaliphila TaxID=2593535 RepID=A0A552WZH0_9GAMM|nr:phosphoglycerate dehydrogenase [Aliidiomarina halalkaliphila]TRW48085.1 phosphoglycerate dehydrogenase [Aliidiomarina halalkaliphila]